MIILRILLQDIYFYNAVSALISGFLQKLDSQFSNWGSTHGVQQKL